jgi:hypothetical protein
LCARKACQLLAFHQMSQLLFKCLSKTLPQSAAYEKLVPIESIIFFCGACQLSSKVTLGCLISVSTLRIKATFIFISNVCSSHRTPYYCVLCSAGLMINNMVSTLLYANSWCSISRNFHLFGVYIS